MVDGCMVKIEVGTVPVEGEIIHRFDNDIEIKITKPFVSLHAGRHIPPHGRLVSSFVGLHGDFTAESLLNDLYVIAEFTERNLEALHEKYVVVKNKIDDMAAVGMTKEKFLRKRKELRQRMRDREIDSNEYGKQLKILRKKMNDYSLIPFRYQWRFLEENYPMLITVSTPEQLIPIIESKRSLKT
jgi:hypothetical protein